MPTPIWISQYPETGIGTVFHQQGKSRMTFDRLKSMHPNLEVLLSSGYAVDGQASDIPKRGCNGFIQKRFNLERLSRKTSEALLSGTMNLNSFHLTAHLFGVSQNFSGISFQTTSFTLLISKNIFSSRIPVHVFLDISSNPLINE